MSSKISSKRERIARVIELIRENADRSARLDQLVAARFGLNRTDGRSFELLMRLGPMTPNRLAAQLGMTTGGVTTVIDRLEKAGYARRRRDSEDRRLVLIEATALAAQKEQEILSDLVAATARLVSSYEEKELAVIADYLERVGKIVAEHNDRLEAFKSDRGAAKGRTGLQSGLT